MMYLAEAGRRASWVIRHRRFERIHLAVREHGRRKHAVFNDFRWTRNTRWTCRAGLLAYTLLVGVQGLEGVAGVSMRLNVEPKTWYVVVTALDPSRTVRAC